MLPVDRRRLILERVAEEQTIRINELAREFHVSEMTIRRDIAALERTGFMRRTYGGATAHLTRSLDPSFNTRALQNAAAKRLIAICAVPLIGDASVLFIGTGTTTEQFVRLMPDHEDVLVVCESLPVAGLLGTRKTEVVVLGGRVHRDELACVGAVATGTVQRYHADIAVLGVAGVTVRHGITELFEEEAENHRLMIERSERVLVLADSTKLSHNGRAHVAPVTAISTLVTDENARPELLAELRQAGVEVVIAHPPSATASTNVSAARQKEANGVSAAHSVSHDHE